MRHNYSPSKKERFVILLVFLCACLLVWVSSLVQLSFFQEDLSSKTWYQLQAFLGLGICLDLGTLAVGVIAFLKRRGFSAIPGVSWFIYLISSVGYGKPSFLGVGLSNVIVMSLLKVVEFLLLTSFHIICLFCASWLGQRHHRNRS